MASEQNWMLDGVIDNTECWTKEDYDDYVRIPKSLVEQLQSEARQQERAKAEQDYMEHTLAAIAEARAEERQRLYSAMQKENIVFFDISNGQGKTETGLIPEITCRIIASLWFEKRIQQSPPQPSTDCPHCGFSEKKCLDCPATGHIKCCPDCNHKSTDSTSEKEKQ